MEEAPRPPPIPMRPTLRHGICALALPLGLLACGSGDRPGTPALVLLDSLSGLDDGLVASPVYIGQDLVVGAGMSPERATERHWIIRRDAEGRWAVTDEYDHRSAPVHFGLWAPGGMGSGHGPDGATAFPGRRSEGFGDRAGPGEEPEGGESGEPAGAVLALLGEWGLVRPRQALVGGYWSPVVTPEEFGRFTDNDTGRRLFRLDEKGRRRWVLLMPAPAPTAADPEGDLGSVPAGEPRTVVTGPPVEPGGAPGGAWGLLSDIGPPGTLDGGAVIQAGVLVPAGLETVPARRVGDGEPLHRILVDTLSSTVEGWRGATPFKVEGVHVVEGPGGSEWAYVRASRPGAQPCESEVLEGWARLEDPGTLHQAVRGTTECGGPGWPPSEPLGVIQTGDRSFVVSLDGAGRDATIGLTELFASTVGSRRGGPAEVEAPASPAEEIGRPADEWAGWQIVLSYLQPAALEGVPGEIVAALETEGCLIPTLQWSGQNAVRGQFAAPGQDDWAVLCSRDGVSEIRIFWGGEARCPQPVAPSADRTWLQGRGDGTAVLSRSIDRSSPRDVRAWLEYYDLDPGISFTHDVLLDVQEGKPVTGYRYCSGGVWITEG